MLGRLHLITDSRPGADPLPQVDRALSAASPDLVIQFRPAARWSDRLVYDLALLLVARCRAAGVPLLINDRVHIACAVRADGVHVGADDLPVAAARQLLGPDRLLGATARTPQAARAALADGADYVGVGPCYVSGTKEGLPDPIGPEGIAAVAAAARPVIAIGGVTAAKVPALLAAGAHGIAVIGAVADAPDPIAALHTLSASIMKLTAGSTVCRPVNFMIDGERGDHAG